MDANAAKKGTTPRAPDPSSSPWRETINEPLPVLQPRVNSMRGESDSKSEHHMATLTSRAARAAAAALHSECFGSAPRCRPMAGRQAASPPPSARPPRADPSAVAVELAQCAQVLQRGDVPAASERGD
eukprot:CAMPEP_0184382116 /NCGR_PEP_ID=MMETSP0007-20130409/6079_1 /TAXON_ID=97485 /ORGANISM="Prymnesium parvum, Strain Texoma1" /LENGTH=127 /DNA_ID=CAMNT_0026728023 /DNA_START=212 /DNA_END=593 /DNA_ORIENTATION=+